MTRVSLIWTLLFGLTTMPIFGQTDEEDKFRTSSDEGLAFNLRGKALTFFILEDAYFATATLGGELLYNSHSFGIDGTYFRWRNEYDDNKDVAMYENYERRKYLLFDYKFGFLYWNQNQLYFNLYYKTGTYKMWYTPQDYDLSIADSIQLNNKSNGTFKELGAGLGYKRIFENSKFGIDISANLARRFSITDKLTFSSYTVSQFEDNVKEDHLLFYMRLNFFYHFNQE